MPKHIAASVKEKIVKARVDERLGITKLAERFGVSTDTVWKLVKPFPLTRSEHRERKALNADKMHTALAAKGNYSGGARWTEEELLRLKRFWLFTPWPELHKLFPGRTRATITKQAADHGFRRSRSANAKPKNNVHPVFKKLRMIRENRRINISELADQIGYHPVFITRIELGECHPSWFMLQTWMDALGCKLELRE